MTNVPTSSDKYCVFRSGAQWYALPALTVRYVAPSPPLFRVPQSPPVLAGLCHLHNEFLAVMHMDLLRGAAEPTAEPTRLLVIAGPQGAWALLVEEIRALAALDTAMSPDAGRSGLAAASLGAATHEGSFVRLLDPNRLYSLAEKCLRQQWSPTELREEVVGLVSTEIAS